VVPQLSGGWQHNYSTKTRQTGRSNEQSMYSLMSMVQPALKQTCLKLVNGILIISKLLKALLLFCKQRSFKKYKNKEKRYQSFKAALTLARFHQPGNPY
jgi:hypothetical protein